MRRLVCALVLLFVAAEALVACSDGLSSATEHADLRAQVETLTSQFDETMAANAEVVELRTQIETLGSQLDGAAATNAEVVDLRAQVETLRSLLAKARGEIGEVESQNSELQATVEDLEGSLAKADAAAPTTTVPQTSEEPPTIDLPEPEVELILTAVYGWGPSSTTEALQTVLGITADGWYGNQTLSAHLTELEARGLPTDGVPVPPTTTVVAAEASAEATATTVAG